MLYSAFNTAWVPSSGSFKCWSDGTYRLARRPLPTIPRFTPWTFEIAPLSLKVRRKSDGELCRVTVYPDCPQVFYAKLEEGVEHSFSSLLENFVQLDGTPCGEEAK